MTTQKIFFGTLSILLMVADFGATDQLDHIRIEILLAVCLIMFRLAALEQHIK